MSLVSVFIVVCVLGCVLQAIFIVVDDKGHKKAAIPLKSLAALCFVVCGILAFINIVNGGFSDIGSAADSGQTAVISEYIESLSSKQDAEIYAGLICIGLFFGMVGDITLAFRHSFKRGTKFYDMSYMAGIAFFLLGHICYLIAVAWDGPGWYLWIVIAFFITTILLHFFYQKANIRDNYKLVGRVYFTILGSVTLISIVKAVMYAVDGGSLTSVPGLALLLFAIGASLFFVSDSLMVSYSFEVVRTRPVRICNLAFYYISQMLIASSLLFV